jgi:DNA-binding NarL/FixJ family response regulator
MSNRATPSEVTSALCAGPARPDVRVDRIRGRRGVCPADSPELAVLGLVADGLTAAAAARRLVGDERTVHKHLERVYAKLGVSDRVSAVLRAQRIGILPESVLTGAG